MNVERMLAQLVLHEGVRLRVYTDTEGNETLGVGYNVTARGFEFFERTVGHVIEPRQDADIITHAEALQVATADVLRIEAAVKLRWPYYLKLDEVRQRVVLDMAFNMGSAALGFKQAIAAIEQRDWSKASRELYKSKWARQVGEGRCDRLARMLLTGADYSL